MILSSHPRSVTIAAPEPLNEVHRFAQRSAPELAIVTMVATDFSPAAGPSSMIGSPAHLVGALGAQVTTNEGGCAQ
jgi:hypothetical protein